MKPCVFYRKWSLDLLQFDYFVPNKVEGLVSRLNQSMDLQDKTFTYVLFVSLRFRGSLHQYCSGLKRWKSSNIIIVDLPFLLLWVKRFSISLLITDIFPSLSLRKVQTRLVYESIWFKGNSLTLGSNKCPQPKKINSEGGTQMNDRLLWILIFSAFLFDSGNTNTNTLLIKWFTCSVDLSPDVWFCLSVHAGLQMKVAFSNEEEHTCEK